MRIPFTYEIGVAVKDRPKSFRVIALGLFIFSMLVILAGAAQSIYEMQTTKPASIQTTKAIQHTAGKGQPHMINAAFSGR